LPVDNSASHPSTPSDPSMFTHFNTSPLPVQSLSPNNEPVNHHPMTTRSKAGIFKPKTFHTVVSHHSAVPTSVQEALSSPSWLQAMHDEYMALLRNHTWSLTSLPAGAKTVGCKWIFKNKFHADGSFQRHKARIVAKGFHQTTGCDYNETYNPVVKPSTIRLVLSHVVTATCPIHQVDVNNAFLNGDLKETFI